MHLTLFAIAPTLFGVDGSVDTGAMAAAAAWMAERGIPDLLLTGSYGEFQSLDDDEREAVLAAVRAVPGVRRIMACAATTSTDTTVRLARRLAAGGADLVMVAAPIAAEVDGDDVARHFSAIAEEVEGDLVVYNNPAFGIDLGIAELERIVRTGAFCAVKQGTRGLRVMGASVAAVHTASAGTTRVLAASDVTVGAALFAGADGVTSTNSWVFPEPMAALVAAAGAGRWEDVRRIEAALRPYYSAVQRLGQPRAVKAAMTLRGLGGGGRVRRPYEPLSEAEHKELDAVVHGCDEALGGLSRGRFDEVDGGRPT